MVYNPYAKKRPRPAEWVSSHLPSSATPLSKPAAAFEQSKNVLNKNHATGVPIELPVTSANSTKNGNAFASTQNDNRRFSPEHTTDSIPRNIDGRKSTIAYSMNDNGLNSNQDMYPDNFTNGVQSIELQNNRYCVSKEDTPSIKSKLIPAESSYVVSNTANYTTKCNVAATTRISTLPPSGMASIRPSSWRGFKDVIHEKSKTLANTLTRDPSKGIQSKPQLQTQYSLNSTSTQYQATNIGKAFCDLPRELTYTPDDVKPIHDEYRMLLIKNAKLSAPLRNGWTLFPHQKKAVIRALTMRRMILALDMGLGKTLIGAVWSFAFKETFGHDKLKVYVICPVSLKEEWRRTAEEKVGLKVQKEERRKSKTKNSQSKKVRKGSDPQNNTDDSDQESIFDMSICSWAKIPKRVESHIEHFVVCCDEAHAMQSTQAQRTKDVLNLVDDKRCVGLVLLTGTPMKNGKPSNLFPLLKAVRHPLGRHQKAYESHFCNGMLKNFGKGATWDATGCSNLEQLKKMIASNLLHMTKEACLKNLPPMTHIFHDVSVSSRFQIQYTSSVHYLANIQAKSRNLCDEAVLGAVQKLRVVCSYAKVEATVELAKSILEKEPAVVIFTFFAQVAKQVHSKLADSGWPCGLLTGETPQRKRQELVDNFQNGLTSGFVCTFGSGGVGLTLTAASTIVLLDRPWTPGETRQAEDRIRRIGQTKDCRSYWMRSFDLDKQIDDMLESKMQTTNAVLDRNGNQAPVVEPKKISINKLVHSFVVSEARKSL